MELKRDQDDRYVEPELFNEGIENPVYPDVDERSVFLPPTRTSHPARDAGKLRDERQRIRNSLHELRDMLNLQKTKLIQEKEEERLKMRQNCQKVVDQQAKVYEELEKLDRMDEKLIILIPKVQDSIDHALQHLREREKMIIGKEQDLIQREQDFIQREKDLIQREQDFIRNKGLSDLPEGSYTPNFK